MSCVWGQATEDAAVKPHRLYVIPPNTSMRIARAANLAATGRNRWFAHAKLGRGTVALMAHIERESRWRQRSSERQ